MLAKRATSGRHMELMQLGVGGTGASRPRATSFGLDGAGGVGCYPALGERVEARLAVTCSAVGASHFRKDGGEKVKYRKSSYAAWVKRSTRFNMSEMREVRMRQTRVGTSVCASFEWTCLEAVVLQYV